VQISSRIRANMDAGVESSDMSGRMAEPGPSSVGRFAPSPKRSVPERPSRNNTRGLSREKRVLIALFAYSRPTPGFGAVGRLSEGLGRPSLRAKQEADPNADPVAAYFAQRGRRRTRRAKVQDPLPTQSEIRRALREAFAAQNQKRRPSVGRLSAALSRRGRL
jgi:hypothetical protein